MTVQDNKIRRFFFCNRIHKYAFACVTCPWMKMAELNVKTVEVSFFFIKYRKDEKRIIFNEIITSISPYYPLEVWKIRASKFLIPRVTYCRPAGEVIGMPESRNVRPAFESRLGYGSSSLCAVSVRSNDCYPFGATSHMVPLPPTDFQ